MSLFYFYTETHTMTTSGGHIRSTKTYIWYTDDVLGTGATSTVYKGRHKVTYCVGVLLQGTRNSIWKIQIDSSW